MDKVFFECISVYLEQNNKNETDFKHVDCYVSTHQYDSYYISQNKNISFENPSLSSFR